MSRRAANELRCQCGSLLARLVAGEVELRCRRCKRAVTLELRVGLEDHRVLVARCCDHEEVLPLA
jgi:phage FluMu protein Com